MFEGEVNPFEGPSVDFPGLRMPFRPPTPCVQPGSLGETGRVHTWPMLFRNGFVEDKFKCLV